MITDCLRLIFNELTDKSTLHSCLLVNKECCRLVVSILWGKYSWVNSESKQMIFNIILFSLPPSSKQLLSDNDIKLPSTIFLKPLLFNYVSYCKFLETGIINNITEMVFGSIFGESDKRKLLEQEIYKLFISQCTNIIELSWGTSHPLSLFPGASTCFPQLHRLYVDVNLVYSDALYQMAQFCKDLDTLIIDQYSQDNSGLISLIDAQRNLKKVIFLYPDTANENCRKLSKVLARKGNTINHLDLNSVNTIPPSFLTSLINLKKLSIHDGNDEMDIAELRHYLEISEFPDLQRIYISELACFKELAMLIEKTKGLISKVIISTTNHDYAENTGMLIRAIANNCPKIKWLSTHLVPEDFIHLRSLLLNCRNLRRVEFDCFENVDNIIGNFGDELLDILTKFSSKSLTDVVISGDWNYSIDAFERFFESYRGRGLLFFQIIHRYECRITEDHKLIVRKYVDEGVIMEAYL